MKFFKSIKSGSLSTFLLKMLTNLILIFKRFAEKEWSRSNKGGFRSKK